MNEYKYDPKNDNANLDAMLEITFQAAATSFSRLASNGDKAAGAQAATAYTNLLRLKLQAAGKVPTCGCGSK